MRRQWFLIVVMTAGLVGMHQLIHVHAEHTNAMASAAPSAHPHPAPIVVTPIPMTSPVAPHGDCCDPMDMMAHFYLAVLTAITALVVVLILAAMWSRPLKSGLCWQPSVLLRRAPPPRGGPPLIQLCVLRC